MGLKLSLSEITSFC